MFKVSLHKLLPTLLSILFYAHLFAQPRSSTLLDNNWKFHFGHTANAEKDFSYGIVNIFSKSGAARGTAIDPAFDDQAWRSLNLPHDWAVELPFAKVDNAEVMWHGYKPVGGLFPETSIGWYRKRFHIAASDSGRRFQLQFDGIYRDANIWLNGFFVGNNKSGYVGAYYDVTDFVRYNVENVLVVRADASQFEGWFYEGAGIYRHVWLNQYDNLHIGTDGVFAHASIKNNSAEIDVETTLQNNGLVRSGATLTTHLFTREGIKVASSATTKFTVAEGDQAVVTQKIRLNDPRLWNLEDPYLYRIVVEVQNGTTLVDQRTLRFGVRDIAIKSNGVFLNGKHLKLFGTNNHQDHAGLGSALPDYMQYYRIGLLKDLGVNAYRTSHNAPTPELLDACDSLGMLVMSEQRLLNSSPEYLDQFTRLVTRDRSRTCLFMWSIGNEEGWIQTNSNGKRIAQTFVALQKKLDPYRTCTYAADLGNVFNGVNEVIPVRSFNYRQFAVADYHRDHPNQPIIGTEMGSTVTTRGEYEKDSIRGYLPDQDITAPWWASRAEDWWTLAASNDFWLGGFVWTGFDYRGEPTPFQWPNISSHFGIMDICGFPKNIYYYYQSWWTDKDVIHISPHWNWRGQEGKTIQVWVNSNADEVELFLNDKSLGKKAMPRNSHLRWDVAYMPGKLTAVGNKKDKLIYAVQETTGTPAEVVMTPYKTTMMADGKDVSVINISVIDREGRTIPDANNMIRFNIKGPGKIIGVSNGDPSSHEPDKCGDGAWQRSLFNGHCQVLVQSDTAAGMISFEATAAGLWKGSTDIVTVPPAHLQQVTIDQTYRLTPSQAKPRPVDKMLGADISFLPELEARGIKFSDKGVEKDAIEILKDHGFNYVRLRVFQNPSLPAGYSPGKGFCDLPHTLAMAKRVKAAGMKLLLDFHYSDYWADPGKQFKPEAWKSLDFAALKETLYDYTRDVMLQLKGQGTTPDMVQVGNEINHGIVWPDGNVANPDGLAQLLNAGTKAVKSVDENVVMMLHVALGGQNHESVFFVDEMLKRNVHFDVIGESYYPKWHGTLDNLRDNLSDLIRRYNKDVIVVEYSALKDEVNRIAFNLPGGHGKGTCIWEPLNTWESVFDRDGKSNPLLLKYDSLSKQFLQ